MSGSETWHRFLGIAGAAVSAAILASCCACGAGGGGGGNHNQPTPHTVTLSWTASTSTVAGYNVYRGTQHSGPYPDKLTSSPQAATTFTDASVQSGVTYYYVVTAEDSNNVQSTYSNEARAAVP